MHALRRLIRSEMDKRAPYKAADLARASGLSPQLVSSLLKDDRSNLDEMPARSTMAGIAKAFDLTIEQVLVAAADAYGVPVHKPIVVTSAEGLPDSELARELLRRAKIREQPVRGIERLGQAALDNDEEP